MDPVELSDLHDHAGAAAAKAARTDPDVGRYVLCVDFDGVVHGYQSGWKGACQIPDPPVPGAFEALLEYARAGIVVAIYSSRSKEPGAILAMQEWMARHWAPPELLEVFRWPTQKPAAAMTIDDRALCFTGRWPTVEWLRSFQPWTKRPVPREPRRPGGLRPEDLAAELVADLNGQPFGAEKDPLIASVARRLETLLRDHGVEL